ncbi:Ubiquitin carboxyl-terminal hydrolase 28 [Tieghemiomyces parasiticus]|uniref:Ubiquitin carboxyl-terminal hydrolase 28 n=1 Tax=Tieghemiomyces parasiticus TaxID=78921 RepID=A0A9W8E3S8_9FUNG|nr:Ubiquitin carboxyl-terminal hydrolase 28 [Tieghemiomyces parasiticus]
MDIDSPTEGDLSPQLHQLLELGIDIDQARAALRRFNQDVSKAANFIFSDGFSQEPDAAPVADPTGDEVEAADGMWDCAPTPPIQANSPSTEATSAWSTSTPSAPGPESQQYTSDFPPLSGGASSGQANSPIHIKESKHAYAPIAISPLGATSPPLYSAHGPDDEDEQLRRAIHASLETHHQDPYNDYADHHHQLCDRLTQISDDPTPHGGASRLASIPESQEDRDLARAIEASTATSVVTAGDPVIPLAWEDPLSPLDRRRGTGQLVGLRPQPDAPVWNLLVQAYFHLPAVRNLVWQAIPDCASWPSPADYWRGHGTPCLPLETGPSLKGGDPPPTVDLLADEPPKPYNEPFIRELGRLFGYLEASKRAYVDASLVRRALTVGVHPTAVHRIDLPVERYLNELARYSQAAHPSPGQPHLLSTLASSHSRADLLDSDVAPDAPLGNAGLPLAYVNVVCPSSVTDQPEVQLPELLQRTLSAQDGTLAIATLADVLCFRMVAPGSRWPSGGARLRLNPTLWPDRYLARNRAQVERLEITLKARERARDVVRQRLAALEEAADQPNAGTLLKGTQLTLQRIAAGDVPCGDLTVGAKELASTAAFIGHQAEIYQATVERLRTQAAELEAEIDRLQDTPELRQHPYHLHAMLCWRGTGEDAHGWVYIRADPADETRRWRKFSDTQVTEVGEHILHTESTAAIRALIYVADRSANPTTGTTKEGAGEEIKAVIPPTLARHVQEDNSLLTKEIRDWMRRTEEEKQIEADERDTFRRTGPVPYAQLVKDAQGGSADSTAQRRRTSIQLQRDAQLAQINTLINEAVSLTNCSPMIVRRADIFLYRAGAQDAVVRFWETDGRPSSDPSDYLLERLWTKDELARYRPCREAYIGVVRLLTSALYQAFEHGNYPQAVAGLRRAHKAHCRWLRTYGHLDATHHDDDNANTTAFAQLSKAGELAHNLALVLKLYNLSAIRKARLPSFRSRGLGCGLEVASLAADTLPSMAPDAPAVAQALRHMWLAANVNLDLADQGAETADQLNRIASTYLDIESPPAGRQVSPRPASPMALEDHSPESSDAWESKNDNESPPPYCEIAKDGEGAVSDLPSDRPLWQLYADCQLKSRAEEYNLGSMA